MIFRVPSDFGFFRESPPPARARVRVKGAAKTRRITLTLPARTGAGLRTKFAAQANPVGRCRLPGRPTHIAPAGDNALALRREGSGTTAKHQEKARRAHHPVRPEILAPPAQTTSKSSRRRGESQLWVRLSSLTATRIRSFCRQAGQDTGRARMPKELARRPVITLTTAWRQAGKPDLRRLAGGFIPP